jgi:hypothetical protein
MDTILRIYYALVFSYLNTIVVFRQEYSLDTTIPFV